MGHFLDNFLSMFIYQTFSKISSWGVKILAVELLIV